jgi:hypothetical protein
MRRSISSLTLLAAIAAMVGVAEARTAYLKDLFKNGQTRASINFNAQVKHGQLKLISNDVVSVKKVLPRAQDIKVSTNNKGLKSFTVRSKQWGQPYTYEIKLKSGQTLHLSVLNYGRATGE